MGRFKKLSHAVYDCKYHIVWCPKYRYRVLLEEKARFVEASVRMLCGWKELEVEALNVQKDHVHVILGIPPKYSVSDVMEMLKGKTAIKMFQRYPEMKKKPYWGNHFWARGYCVSTIGLDEEKIKKYVQYQEEEERQEESQQLEFGF
ncbi:MAG TPA: IS200/IS605 family transposase [Candidatus Omnitrophica bacterium]|nr:MAG: hypothetical protein A2Y05_03850 [Omnitrophica WOR_2 bacterium GWA2_53_43]HCI44195.1 IS200/IS605 family transposase [Candidatus Omnitrophota bacterium]